MAFSRSFRTKPRRTFKRGFKRPVARVRRTWITSVNATLCNVQSVPLVGCSELPDQNRFRIVIVNNTVLEDKFSDRATLVRIVGDLWLDPVWDAVPDTTCDDQFGVTASAYTQMFVGLRRFEVNSLGAALVVDPLDSDADLSESQWLKTWQHTWFPHGGTLYTPTYTSHGCGVSVCADTHTSGALSNDFVDGTGTIEIETTCNDPVTTTCDAVQDSLCQQQFDYPQPWHLHLDVKKRVPMREDQEVALEFQSVAPWAANPSAGSPRFEWWGNLRALLQY